MFQLDTKWIWLKEEEKEDEYASFLTGYRGGNGKIILKLAAEMNYIAYVNGRRVAFGQFPGYRDIKYYDEIDITEYSSTEENELRIVVRYEGINTSTHILDKAGVIFEVISDGKVLCRSNESTLGGVDSEYQQHVCRLVTRQLGYSVNMCYGGKIVYDSCREVDLSYNLKKRPVEKLIEEPPVYGRRMELAEVALYDFEREYAGAILLEVYCQKECDIVLAYGEHIVDGRVRQKVGKRDFSMHFKCREGKNTFEQLFLRIAGRYVEVQHPEGVSIEYVAIVPTIYPMEETGNFLTGREREIYDASVRTLRLCMHEHYEDCPWREQALYIMDSRNQMLCGYYAFKDTAFARANIVYMVKGVREDGLLELVFPAINTPTIPFFSLMYPVVVWEYIQYTGDLTILEEVMPVAIKIMEKFKSRLERNGLISSQPDGYWNFYEWSEGSSGDWTDKMCKLETGDNRYDLILNCAFVYSGIRYQELCRMYGGSYDVELENVKKRIKEFFYCEKRGMFFLSNQDRERFSQLGNAFARLIGLEGRRLTEAIKGENGVIPVTLAMSSFVYDALLADDEKNAAFVLADINAKYGYMLDCGATTFWETIKGQEDFAGAGSLCHGWSAMPVYYYSTLLKKTETRRKIYGI